MKKKIVALCLVVCLLAIAIVGGTLAYFTDTHAQTNTFTAGNVDITLDEAKVVKVDTPSAPNYGDLIAVGSGERTSEDQDYEKLYPGQKIWKDPTIKNVGSEDAYIAAKVTVTSDGNLYSILGATDYDILALNDIISGGIEDEPFDQESWNGLFGNNCESYFLYQDADKASNTYVLYFFIKKAISTNATITLFNTISIPETWNNTEMAQLKGLSIEVQAYATQEHGFADCYTAMITAFPTEFNF